MALKYFHQILHTYACQHCLTTDMHNSFLMDEALLSICPAGGGQLLKMLLNLMVYLDPIWHTYLFQHFAATGMQNGDEASASIISAG